MVLLLRFLELFVPVVEVETESQCRGFWIADLGGVTGMLRVTLVLLFVLI